MFTRYDVNDGNYGNKNVRLFETKITTEESKGFVTINDSFEIVFKFELFTDFEDFNLSVPVKNVIDESIVFAQITKSQKIGKGLHQGILKFPSNFLNAKSFSLDIYFVNSAKSFFKITDIINFAIEDDRTGLNYYGDWPGYIRPNLSFLVD